MSEQPASGGLLGQTALRNGWISAAQLEQAVEEQSVLAEPMPLGELLVSKGWLTRSQLEQILDGQKKLKEQARLARLPGYSSTQISQEVLAELKPGRGPVAGTNYEINELLKKAVGAGAGDFHLHSGAPMFARIQGSLRPASSAPTAPERTQQLLEPILSQDQLAVLRQRGEVDLAHDVAEVGRFRTNVYRHAQGWSGVFRHVPLRPPKLEELGLSGVARLANFHQGMVLITGPGGSGKSSTLAALVELINNERSEHILTIEDPVEFLFTSRKSTINQRQVEQHTNGYAQALRAALREDPDIIVIGELRDAETISLALTAAETGHLVLSTMTTTNVIRTIERVISVFPPRQQNQVRTMLSETLRGVVAQQLLDRKDGRGRVAAYELLLVDAASANLIREEKTYQIESILQTGASRGMQLLDQAIGKLLKDGVINRLTARQAADDPSRFEEQQVAGAEWAR